MLLPGFRPDVLCFKGFDLFVMSSITEGLGTSLLDAMAAADHRRHRGGRHSRSRGRRRHGAARAAARPAAMADAIVRLLKDPRCAADGMAGLARARDCSAPSGC